MVTNGKIPSDQLRTVIGVPMLKSTANAVERLVASAKNDNVAITSWAGYGGYRDTELQSAMKTTKRPGDYGMSAATQKLLSAVGSSPHGLGRAIDFKPGSNNIARKWLIKNGHVFGFSRPMATNDPNHWIHDGRTGITPMSTLPTRVVGKDGANKRALPKKTGQSIISTANPNTTLEILGWITGETVNGNSSWLQAKDRGYYHISGFTTLSRDGLPNLNPIVTPPVVTPPVVTPPTSITLPDAQVEFIIAEVVKRVKPLIPTKEDIAAAVRAAIIK